MEGTFSDLVAELRTLRKGRGLYVGQISERVGTTLREVCGITEHDGPADIRRKIGDWLTGVASGLPDDLRIALLAAFGIEAEARLPFYQDRVRYAAEKIHRDDRTARRRIDEAIDRVAELATSSPGSTNNSVGHEMSPSGWHTEQLHISVALDQPVPEVLEWRRIIAERDQLTELDLAMTLTAGPTRDHVMGVDELSVDVFYGGMLVRKAMESSDRYGLVLALPEALTQAGRHDFAIRYRPSNGSMRPHFVCVPKHRCDLFELRVRFNLDRIPATIFQLKEKFQRDVDDPTPSGEIIPSNAAGEVHVVFHQLIPGRAYGIRWTY